MKLHSILTARPELREATTSWVGKFRDELGSGQPYTLNYGTGTPDRPSILYVPIPLSHIRAISRRLDKLVEVQGFRNPSRQIRHVGEAHVTISMGPELATALGTEPAQVLQQSGLFDAAGSGVAVTVRHTGQFKVLNAAYYKDQKDPEGPQLVAEIVVVPRFEQIRTRLGLTPLPQIPGIGHYLPHLTIGYLANKNLIDRSYVDRFGSTQRPVPAATPG